MHIFTPQTYKTTHTHTHYCINILLYDLTVIASVIKRLGKIEGSCSSAAFELLLLSPASPVLGLHACTATDTAGPAGLNLSNCSDTFFQKPGGGSWRAEAKGRLWEHQSTKQDKNLGKYNTTTNNKKKWNPSHCPKPGANNNPVLPPAHFSVTYPVQSPYRELHTSYLCLAQAPLNVTWKLPSRPFPLNPKFSTQGRWKPRISSTEYPSLLHMNHRWKGTGKQRPCH